MDTDTMKRIGKDLIFMSLRLDPKASNKNNKIAFIPKLNETSGQSHSER